MSYSSAPRGSKRILEEEKRRVLDESTRNRRLKQALEALEADNHQEAPEEFEMSKNAPLFEDPAENRKSNRLKKKTNFKIKYPKSLQQLIDLDKKQHPEAPNYSSAVVGPSKLPQRYFCAVCGFIAKYTCVTCGARYCSVDCLPTHKDTRCLKWTA